MIRSDLRRLKGCFPFLDSGCAGAILQYTQCGKEPLKRWYWQPELRAVRLARSISQKGGGAGNRPPSLHVNKGIESGFRASRVVGQATKGLWGMPWCQRPKKGVVRLRKASVSRLTDLAGDTRIGEPIPMQIGIPLAEHNRLGVVSGGTETSKYPEEKKAKAIPQVAVSERGTA